ncbi:MAG: dihydrofolate reductase [Alphaproteobacteria bacterium]|nr:dihydrofolate reductase [Alphaproteobacteria bacterium]MCW5738630.1 dihydrofolate reductase [Alphaproteobacteria bacterium]
MRPLILGYVIVSREGAYATADGHYPDVLKIEADQIFYRDALRSADAIAHGRRSAERDPQTRNKPRLTATRSVAGLAPDPKRRHGLLWNPAGASFDDAWRRLGLTPDSTLAVVGGAGLFGVFLDIGYETFFLTQCRSASMPDGRLTFPEMEGRPDLTPQAVLTRHAYRMSAQHVLDAATDTVLEQWRPS